MSTELYIPNILNRPGTEFYRHSETFKRRSAASKIRAAKYWADGRHHRRVDKKQAKPVAAYRMDGSFVGWWPSARKAAKALFQDESSFKMERIIRNTRHGEKKSCKGYMFRDWTGDTSPIEPYTVKPHKSGYHVNRRRETYATKPCTVDYGDGDPIRFESLKELAAAIGGTYGGVWAAMKGGRKYKGKTIKLI
jgi:hypothetical protein